jgi:hypothetical protein
VNGWCEMSGVQQDSRHMCPSLSAIACSNTPSVVMFLLAFFFHQCLIQLCNLSPLLVLSMFEFFLFFFLLVGLCKFVEVQQHYCGYCTATKCCCDDCKCAFVSCNQLKSVLQRLLQYPCVGNSRCVADCIGTNGRLVANGCSRTAYIRMLHALRW